MAANPAQEQSLQGNGAAEAAAAAAVTKGGRSKVARKDYDLATETFTIIFLDNETAPTTISVKLDEFSPQIQTNLALHGLAQKLGDSFASAGGEVETAKELFFATLETLRSGEWAKAREGDGTRLNELIDAIARIKGVAVEKAQAAVAKATEEQLKNWKNAKAVKAVIAEMRAEKARAKADEGESADPLAGLAIE